MDNKKSYCKDSIKELFFEYKNELKQYCEDSIKRHIEDGNAEVFTFSLYFFPQEYRVIATLNTVENLQEMFEDNGFEEATRDGILSEAYNPACFDVHFDSSESYEKVEDKIQSLFNSLDSDKNKYVEGSREYSYFSSLIDFMENQFIRNIIDALKEVDFLKLNCSERFCVFPTHPESDSEETYSYIKEILVNDEKFNFLFPNIYEEATDSFGTKEALGRIRAIHQVRYLYEFYMDFKPEQMAYTKEIAGEKFEELMSGDKWTHDSILRFIEDIIKYTKPNLLSLNENQFINSILSPIINCSDFLEETQERLVFLMNKTLTGPSLSTDQLSHFHTNLARAIRATDPEKYPEVQLDSKSGYISNYKDYLN